MNDVFVQLGLPAADYIQQVHIFLDYALSAVVLSVEVIALSVRVIDEIGYI